MIYVHPKDLKIGDVVKYVSKDSWISSNCNDGVGFQTRGIIGFSYRVYKIEKTTEKHISEEPGANNPLLESLSNPEYRNLSAWWGSWVLVSKNTKQPKVFGIVKFCERMYK